MERIGTRVSWEVFHREEVGEQAFPDRTEIGHATPTLRNKGQEKAVGSLKHKHQSGSEQRDSPKEAVLTRRPDKTYQPGRFGQPKSVTRKLCDLKSCG